MQSPSQRESNIFHIPVEILYDTTLRKEQIVHIKSHLSSFTKALFRLSRSRTLPCPGVLCFSYQGRLHLRCTCNSGGAQTPSGS